MPILHTESSTSFASWNL